MPFIVDDMAIAAAIAAAETAAAEAAATTAATAAAAEAAAAGGAGAGAAGAAGAAGGEAGAGLAASQAAEAAAGQAATQAATEAATQAATTQAAASAPSTTGITDAMTQAANSAQSSLGTPINVAPTPVAPGPVAPAPVTGPAPTGPIAPTNVAPPPMVEGPVAPPAVGPESVATPPVSTAPQPLPSPVDVTPPPMVEGPTAPTPTGPETSASPPIQPSISDTLSNYATKVGNTLTSPEFLVPMALQGASALMSNSAYDNAGDYTDTAMNTATNSVKKEEARSNKAVEDWGQNYLSPEAVQKNQDEAYAKLAADYVGNQDRAQKELGGVVGATPDEYSKAMAGATANSAQDAANYANKLAKAQAPAFADLGANIGEMKANRETTDALSNMKTAGAEGYNALGSVPGDPKLLAAAALRGLGGGLSTILGK